LLTRHAPVGPVNVLDPFAGSGTTIVVAERLGHRALGMESDPEHARVAMMRLAAARGATA